MSEQVDSLRVLFTDPVDYLVTPRVLASMIAGPILNVLCFCMGKCVTRLGVCCHTPPYNTAASAAVQAVPAPLDRVSGDVVVPAGDKVSVLSAGIGASVLLADLVYDVPANVILDSARRALSGYDVITSCIKAWVFGLIISTVRDMATGVE